MCRFTTKFKGDKAIALKVAQRMMAERGFEVSRKSDDEVHGRQRPNLLSNKMNDMIVLISGLSIRVGSSQVTAETEFGSVKKEVFLMVSIIVGIQIGFIVVGYRSTQDLPFVLITLATGAWAILVGLVAIVVFRKMALHEVETLLNNIAAAAENE